MFDPNWRIKIYIITVNYKGIKELFVQIVPYNFYSQELQVVSKRSFDLKYVRCMDTLCCDQKTL